MGSHRVQIRQKAAALDAEEQKRRFQVSLAHLQASVSMFSISRLLVAVQASTSAEGASEAQGPNMQRFVQQLSGKVMMHTLQHAFLVDTVTHMHDTGKNISSRCLCMLWPHMQLSCICTAPT